MYKTYRQIAATLLTRFFEFESIDDLNRGIDIMQIAINEEDNDQLKYLLNTLINIYKNSSTHNGGLTLPEINNFFFILSSSSYFKEHFNTLLKELFQSLSSREKNILLNPQPFLSPIYAPIKISNDQTYSYNLIKQLMKDNPTLRDPLLDHDRHNQLTHWYNQRGLKKIWKYQAIANGAIAWHSLEERFYNGQAFPAVPETSVVTQGSSLKSNSPQRHTPVQRVTFQLPLPEQPAPLPPSQQPLSIPITSIQTVSEQASDLNAISLPQQPPTAPNFFQKPVEPNTQISTSQQQSSITQPVQSRLNSPINSEVVNLLDRIRIICIGSNAQRKSYLRSIKTSTNHIDASDLIRLDFIYYKIGKTSFQIYETLGFERHCRELTPAYYKTADAIVIIPDNPDDFRYYYRVCKNKKNGRDEEIPLFLLDVPLDNQPRSPEENRALVEIASSYQDVTPIQLSEPHTLDDFCIQIKRVLLAKKLASEQFNIQEEKNPNVSRRTNKCSIQ